jgi:hypothetical protein
MHPNSWHYLDRFDPSMPARHYTRSERPPKYYFIDFGLWRRYNTKIDLPQLIICGDRSMLEFQNSNGPCNPFQTDIYYLGNSIQQQALHPG